MLKALLKKEFMALTAGITTDRRKGTRRSKGGIIGLAILFAFCYISLGTAFLGFSTANVLPRDGGEGDILSLSCIREEKIDLLFRAAGEATEEAILNSMLCADPVTAPDGRRIRSLKEFMPL